MMSVGNNSAAAVDSLTGSTLQTEANFVKEVALNCIFKTRQFWIMSDKKNTSIKMKPIHMSTYVPMFLHQKNTATRYHPSKT